MQLILQFYADSIETSHVLRPWSEDVHIFVYNSHFCPFFHKMNLVIFPSQNEWILGILCTQLLLQFYADSFETLQVFSSWSEDVHIFGYNPQIIFVIFFFIK